MTKIKIYKHKNIADGFFATLLLEDKNIRLLRVKYQKAENHTQLFGGVKNVIKDIKS